MELPKSWDFFGHDIEIILNMIQTTQSSNLNETVRPPNRDSRYRSTLGGLELRNYGEAVLAALDPKLCQASQGFNLQASIPAN